MGINILKERISKNDGFQKANRVEIRCPAKIQDFHLMDIAVTSFNLPQRNLMTTQYQLHDQLKTKVDGYAVNNVTLTFRGSNSWKLYEAFNSWLEESIGSHTYGMKYRSQYAADFFISPLSEAGWINADFKLVNAHPINLGEISMGNDAENQIMTFNVELVYDKFYYYSHDDGE